METCQIFAAGYPDRLPFEETVRIFRIAVFGLRRGGVRHREERATQIMMRINVTCARRYAPSTRTYLPLW